MEVSQYGKTWRSEPVAERRTRKSFLRATLPSLAQPPRDAIVPLNTPAKAEANANTDAALAQVPHRECETAGGLAL